MAIDLSKLTPAPWRVAKAIDGYFIAYGSNPVTPTGYLSNDDAESIALGRNALDVMMRRGWSPCKIGDGWCIDCGDGEYFYYGKGLSTKNQSMYHCAKMVWTDPFTGLVEADKWYKENVQE